MEYLGRADEAVIAISNYRLHIKFKDSVINVSPRQCGSPPCCRWSSSSTGKTVGLPLPGLGVRVLLGYLQ